MTPYGVLFVMFSLGHLGCILVSILHGCCIRLNWWHSNAVHSEQLWGNSLSSPWEHCQILLGAELRELHDPPLTYPILTFSIDCQLSPAHSWKMMLVQKGCIDGWYKVHLSLDSVHVATKTGHVFLWWKKIRNQTWMLHAEGIHYEGKHCTPCNNGVNCDVFNNTTFCKW